MLPAVSVAMAVNIWEPFVVRVVSKLILYGEVESEDLRLLPSNLNWTPVMPVLSVALAVIVIVPETVAPFVGEVIETVGGMMSPAEAATEKEIV